jgi:hypothetical protein
MRAKSKKKELENICRSAANWSMYVSIVVSNDLQPTYNVVSAILLCFVLSWTEHVFMDCEACSHPMT